MVKYTKKSRGGKYRSRKYRGGGNIVVPQSQLQHAITSTKTLLNELNEIENNPPSAMPDSDAYGMDSQFSTTSNNTNSPSTSFSDENYQNDLNNLNSVDTVPADDISYNIDNTPSVSTSPNVSTNLSEPIMNYLNNVKLQPSTVITTYNGNDITLGQIKSQLNNKINMQRGKYAAKYQPVLAAVNSATSATDVLNAIKPVYKNGIISGGKTKKRRNGRKTRRY